METVKHQEHQELQDHRVQPEQQVKVEKTIQQGLVVLRVLQVQVVHQEQQVLQG